MIIMSNQKREVIDITDRVAEGLAGNGVVHVFVKHTTAAVTTADLDPGTDNDYLRAIASLTPKENWEHPHDPTHFPDHLWAALIGPSLTVPYQDGTLLLGTWQRVILLEFNGPRERHVAVVSIPKNDRS